MDTKAKLDINVYEYAFWQLKFALNKAYRHSILVLLLGYGTYSIVFLTMGNNIFTDVMNYAIPCFFGYIWCAALTRCYSIVEPITNELKKEMANES